MKSNKLGGKKKRKQYNNRLFGSALNIRQVDFSIIYEIDRLECNRHCADFNLIIKLVSGLSRANIDWQKSNGCGAYR